MKHPRIVTMRQPKVIFCQHCGKKFTPHDQKKNRKYCSHACSNSARSRHIADKAVPDTADHDTADYPGTEWGPLPPALLIKVAARVLAAEFAAWAVQQKAINHAQ